MTVVTNSILRSSYGTVPSDEIQQVAEDLPVSIQFSTYETKLIASLKVTEEINGAFRLSVSGHILGPTADIMLWFSKKDYGKIDCSCQPGWWCGIGPGYFTFIQDPIENIRCIDIGGDSSVTIPKINVGDIIELWGYYRYIGSNKITINDFSLKFTRIQKLPLYVAVFGCKDEIPPEGTSQITVHTVDDKGIPINEADVELSVTTASVPGILDITSGTTDINGDLKVMYTAPRTTTLQIDKILVTASMAGYVDGSDYREITINPLLGIKCIVKTEEGIYSKPTYCYVGEGIFIKR